MEAFRLYRGLRDANVDSHLIIYTGFGHVIDKPTSLLAVEQANLDWFSHYIWGLQRGCLGPLSVCPRKIRSSSSLRSLLWIQCVGRFVSSHTICRYPANGYHVRLLIEQSCVALRGVVSQLI
jgi:hypothetical protein